MLCHPPAAPFVVGVEHPIYSNDRNGLICFVRLFMEAVPNTCETRRGSRLATPSSQVKAANSERFTMSDALHRVSDCAASAQFCGSETNSAEHADIFFTAGDHTLNASRETIGIGR